MSVTGRARWIIALCIAAALFALLRQHILLFRFALTVLIWICFEGFAFRYRCDVYLNKLQADRVVRDRQGAARVLWATRPASVTTKLTYRRGWLGWFAPDFACLPAIRATVHDLLPTGAELVRGSNGCALSLGDESDATLHFSVKTDAPGVVKFNGLRFVLEDLHGFFYAERFLYRPQEFRVMPLSMDLGTIHTIRKRANVLPPPGLHTVSKAGPGSELMEIREYQPGDPPRSIAWKVSARRDELMCKQFESEVPVRCQLLVDMSRAVRLGFPGPCLGGQLVSLASTIAFTLTAYRDPVGISLFDGDEVRIARPSASRRATLRAIDTLCDALSNPLPPVDIPPSRLIRSGYDIARVRYPAAIRYAEHSLTSLWPSRSITRIRRRLSAVLANHFGMDRQGMGELEGDDQAFSYWLQRFHTDLGAPYTGELYDKNGKYLFEDRQKISQLAQLLHRNAAKGRDNELFVILAELTDDDYDLTPLVDSIKYARARHHRVAVVSSWPPRLPGPESLELKSDSPTRPVGGFHAELRYQKEAYQKLRSEMLKLGVPVAAAAEDAATTMVLNQLAIIRTGRAVA